MKVFKILYDEIVVGIVVNKDGSLSANDATTAWNEKNPSYAGDSAEEANFLEA